MKFLNTAILLLGILVLPTTSTAQQSKAPTRQPAAERAALFTGNGMASWLPKTALLPTAADLETTAQKLSSRMRNVDPFGLPTFPREEDLQLAQQPSLRPTAKPTLNQALQTIRVTGINLKRKEFLVGGRNVYEGDVMQLQFQNEVFMAQVVEVAPSQITFRDLERLDIGVLTHTLLPKLKMEPAGNRTKMNGLEDKLSPLEINSARNKP